jgi:hypothetical protein
MSIANIGLRFVVELLGVAALGYSGFATLDGMPWRLVAGIGAPALLIAVWALVVAPNADNALQPRARELIGTGLLLVAAAALARAGQPAPAAALAATVLVNQVLLIVIDPGPAVALLHHAGPRT